MFFDKSVYSHLLAVAVVMLFVAAMASLWLAIERALLPF